MRMMPLMNQVEYSPCSCCFVITRIVYELFWLVMQSLQIPHREIQQRSRRKPCCIAPGQEWLMLLDYRLYSVSSLYFLSFLLNEVHFKNTSSYRDWLHTNLLEPGPFKNCISQKLLQTPYVVSTKIVSAFSQMFEMAMAKVSSPRPCPEHSFSVNCAPHIASWLFVFSVIAELYFYICE